MLKKFGQPARARDSQSPSPPRSGTPNTGQPQGPHQRCRSIPSSELLADLAQQDLLHLPGNLFNHLHITSLDLRHNKLGEGIRAELRNANANPGSSDETPAKKGIRDLEVFTHLTRLNLANNGLKELPAGIGVLGTLIVLNLTGNELTALPSEIGKLSRLQRLHCDFNRLSSLPSDMESLSQNLTHVTLSFNQFIEVPVVLGKLSCLQSLMLKANYLTNLSAQNLQCLKSLRSFDVRGNSLTGKIHLHDLQFLEVLNLSKNPIEELELSAMKKLHTLDCSRCNLTSLIMDSQNIRILISNFNVLKTIALTGSPTSLHAVNISHNQIDALPQWVYEAPEIFTLNASHNKIKQVFERIFRTPTIDTLNLSHNHLRCLPEMTNPSNVRRLLLQNNRIACLQDNIFHVLPRLEDLNLSYNQLMTLPVNSSTCHSVLRQLHLNGNLLTSDSLVKIASSFPNLHRLTVAYNRLESFPESCTEGLPHLVELSVSGNLLKTLPSNIASIPKLRILRAHSNVLRGLPVLSTLQNLEVVDVSCNRLQKLSLTPILSPKLSHLDISCNSQLHMDPEEFKKLCTGKAVAFVDSCCLGRKLPPMNKRKLSNESLSNLCPWKIGFTESQSGVSRITVDQKDSNRELLIAVIESGKDGSCVYLPTSVLSQISQAESQKSSEDVLKSIYVSISVYLRMRGASLDTSLILCQVVTSNAGFTLRIASNGTNKCLVTSKGKVLELPNGLQKLVATDADWMSSVQSGFFSDSSKEILPVRFLPKLPSEVVVLEAVLGPEDTHIILGSSSLWESLNTDLLFKEIRKDKSPSEISKRLFETVCPDVAGEDVCILVVRLVASANRLSMQLDDRDSGHHDLEASSFLGSDEDSIEEGEKYKCWEYMLEQNHKLLFNRELETINRSILKESVPRTTAADLSKQMAMQSFVSPIVPAVVQQYSPVPVHHGFYHYAGCAYPQALALRTQAL